MRAVVRWQAMLITGAMVVVGVPLGVIAGRLVIRSITTTLGIVPTIDVPVWLGVLAGVVVPLVVAGVLTKAAAFVNCARVDGPKKLQSMEELFEGRHFEREIIILCVRWYLRFKLSLRDLVEMMAERGLPVAHTTIMRWVQRFVPEFEKRWKRFARRPFADRGESTRPT